METTTTGAVVWSKILSGIKGSCTSQQYQTWFSRLAPGEIDEKQLEILVPNQFLKDWLLKNYQHLIADSAKDAVGRELEILYRVAEVGDALPPVEEPPAEVRNRPPATPRSRPEPKPDIDLNPSYSFENFIVGPSNRVPHAAAMAVVASPGTAYNPLFLHGSVGLGKTHLLQSICHALLKKNLIHRFLYLSCETFVNHFISAIENGKLDDFRYNYRHVDMLLIDDVQFLAKKERTQEEFFHTFNTLYNSQKQIVLTCDSPPSELKSIQERLVSRFNWGLVTHLQLPDYETRVAIIQNKANLMNFTLPEDVAHFAAERVQSNVRDLEGAITKIVGYARLARRSADLALAREALHDVPEQRSQGTTLDEIVQTVVAEFGVKKNALLSKRRLKSIAFPRQICMYIARKVTHLSLEEIGNYFGGRDHTTVLYGADKIARLVETDRDLERLIEDLGRRIRH